MKNTPLRVCVSAIVISVSAALLLAGCEPKKTTQLITTPAITETAITEIAITEIDKVVIYYNIHHPVIGRKGMVVSQSELASDIGADILHRGGNAIDAAVAVGYALAVTLPRAGNLTGGGFMMVHLAEQNKTVPVAKAVIAASPAVDNISR